MYVGIPMARIEEVISGLQGLRRAMGKLERTQTTQDLKEARKREE